MPRLSTVIASTRPGRSGLAIGTWFHGIAEAHGGFDAHLVDLAALDLPFMDEPHHPRLARYEHEHTRRWSALVGDSDAFVFVTAEYNHGFTAPLKNAIDYLWGEWRYKPVGFVSYGGVAAGTRAVQMLKPVVSALSMVPLPEAVPIPFHKQHIGEDGCLQATEIMITSAREMLDELAVMEATLRPLRAPASAPRP